MAYKLHQSNPPATTLTDLYTVPAGKAAVISTIAVAAVGGTVDGAFRIALRQDGSAVANQHYVAKDVTLAMGEAKYYTLGITMEETDVLSVYASHGSIAFNAFVDEVDV